MHILVITCKLSKRLVLILDDQLLISQIEFVFSIPSQHHIMSTQLFIFSKALFYTRIVSDPITSTIN